MHCLKTQHFTNSCLKTQDSLYGAIISFTSTQSLWHALVVYSNEYYFHNNKMCPHCNVKFQESYKRNDANGNLRPLILLCNY
jgi:hypothetical protein